MQEVKLTFKPELLNRIDEIIVFNRLNTEEIRKITDLMLEKLVKRMEAKDIYISIDDKLKDVILEKGKDINYGARPLRRAIQNLVEDKIAEGILEGKILKNKEACLSFENEKVVINNVYVIIFLKYRKFIFILNKRKKGVKFW